MLFVASFRTRKAAEMKLNLHENRIERGRLNRLNPPDLSIIQAVKLVDLYQTERKEGGLNLLGHENNYFFVHFS